MSYDLSQKMLPRLKSLTFFEPGSFKKSDKPDVLEDGSWVIEGEFQIYDQKLKDYNRSLPFYRRKVGNKDGDTGYVFPILVCSQDFVKIHKDRIAADIVKPIVFEDFSRERVEEYINDKVNALGEVTFDELIECLDQFSWAKYDIEDEEWPKSMSNNKD